LPSCQLAGCGYLSHLPWHFRKGLCESLVLTQSVNFLTWISTNRTPSLLDLILTNFPENVCCSSSTPIGSSDHMLVKAIISLAVIREPLQRQRVWHFHPARLAGSSSSHQTSRLVSHFESHQHELILGIFSKKFALSHAQIYPISSSVILPFLPPMVH